MPTAQLVKNQDALSHLQTNINHKFSVLAITETWVKESNVTDFSFDSSILLEIEQNWQRSHVRLFIDKISHNKILTEFNVSNGNIIESLFIEITFHNIKIPLIIGVFHRPRPPSENTLEFTEKINEIISGVTKGNTAFLYNW